MQLSSKICFLQYPRKNQIDKERKRESEEGNEQKLIYYLTKKKITKKVKGRAFKPDFASRLPFFHERRDFSGFASALPVQTYAVRFLVR